MIRQQNRITALARATAIIAVAFVFQALLPSRAAAVTLNIDSTYVFYKSSCAVLSPTGNSVAFLFVCPTTASTTTAPSPCAHPFCGNISNEPHIEFERDPGIGAGSTCYDQSNPANSLGPVVGTIGKNYCNDSLFLCAAIGYSNELTSGVNVDELMFEVFKFQDGSNPLDPGSTPPLRTIYVDNPGVLLASNTTIMPPRCVLFDGSTNIQGEFGKTNGQYGFRVTARTQIQSGAAGNITITAIRAYPGGATQDSNLAIVSQKPISVDVTNVHFVRASATIVGSITGVSAEPYNLSYRLSKDSTMYISIDSPVLGHVRNLVLGAPRSGEGTPNGTLLNGDSWNGRFDNGNLGPPGQYLATFQAFTIDQYGRDLSYATTRQINLDPLIITDIRVSSLEASATALAVISYQLTEPATTYIDIYPPGTQFCSPANGVVDPLNNVNNALLDSGVANSSAPPKDFQPHLNSCAGPSISPLKSLAEQKGSRTTVSSFWDGRDKAGVLQPDGDYVFVMYAALPSQNGFAFNGVASDARIWTSQAKSGFIPVNRGYVGISQISPASSVIGSSPAVAGLNPFFFRYTLSRDANVTMRIFDATGANLIKTLVSNELRPGLFANTERWDEPVGDNGRVVSSGTYLVQLSAADPLAPSKISTTTAQFPVNLFRITDAQTTPLLSGTSDFANFIYQLSQTMFVGLNIYSPGTTIVASTATWPPCASLTPGVCSQTLNGGQPTAPIITITGLRPGRRLLTESWDGRNTAGLLVSDGSYLFTLAAQSTTTPQYFASDKIFGSITVARGAVIFTSFAVKPDVPTLFNSSNTITLDPFNIQYGLTRQSSVTIQILTATTPSTVVRTIVAGGVREAGILLDDVWDGRDDFGNFPRSGFYNVRATARDLASTLASGSTAQLTIVYDPLRVYDLAITPLHSETNSAVISYQVSETMKVAVKIYRPGTIFDSAGNPSPPEESSLVKRIIGIKPARVQIQDFWDGTDLRQSIAPDGSYKFRILASTDTNAIDTLTGNVIRGASLSLDQPIDDIPVVRGASLDPASDFVNNTYIYPNPVTGPTATIQIYVPIQAKVTMKIYNIAGELIMEQDYGEVPSGQCVQDAQCRNGISWAKTNKSGRTIGRGLYYAVIRQEETLGGRNMLQTVKKILIP